MNIGEIHHFQDDYFVCISDKSEKFNGGFYYYVLAKDGQIKRWFSFRPVE